MNTLGKVVVNVCRANRKPDPSTLWQGCCSGVTYAATSIIKKNKQRTSASERYISVSFATALEKTESESDQNGNQCCSSPLQPSHSQQRLGFRRRIRHKSLTIGADWK